MKRCYKCDTEKALSEFSINENKSDGLNLECKDCQKKYFADYYAKNKEKHCKRVRKVIDNKKAAVAKYKKDKGCNRCGYNEHSAALQFHHLNPNEKDFTIAGSWSLPLDEIFKEINKCEVLCANCHSIEHATREYDFTAKTKTTKKRLDKRKPVNETSKYKEQKPRIKKSNIPDDEILKKLLFEIPSWTLAKQFNCSDSYLSHYCKNRGIDKPPRGYWRQNRPKISKEGT